MNQIALLKSQYDETSRQLAQLQQERTLAIAAAQKPTPVEARKLTLALTAPIRQELNMIPAGFRARKIKELSQQARKELVERTAAKYDSAVASLNDRANKIADDIERVQTVKSADNSSKNVNTSVSPKDVKAKPTPQQLRLLEYPGEEIRNDNREPGAIKINAKNASHAYFRDLNYPPGTRFSFIVYSKHGDIYVRSPMTPRTRTELTSENVAEGYFSLIDKRYNGNNQITYVKAYTPNNIPQDFTLFTGRTLNCVFEAIRAATADTPNAAAIEKRIIKYTTKHNYTSDRAVTKKDASAIMRAIRVRLIIHSQVGIWFDTDPADSRKFKQIHLYASRNHASVWKDISTIRACVEVSANELNNIRKELHQPIKLTMKVTRHDNDFDISYTSIHAGDTIYRTYRIPAEYRDKPEYYTCTSALAFEYKRWKLENHIRPLTGVYQLIAKSAAHTLGTQQFSDYRIGETLHNYDQNGAYPNYARSKYYSTYGLVAGCVRLFANTDLSHVANSGISLVLTVTYTNDFARKVAPIQPGNWYWHHELQCYLDENICTYTISHTVTAFGRTVSLPMGSDYAGLSADDRRDAKYFNNAFIGKLISGGVDDSFDEHYYVSNKYPGERMQLEYELQSKPGVRSVMFDEVTRTVVANVKSGKSNQLWHIHGQITAYQRAHMITTMSRYGPSIVAYCVDGFYTRGLIGLIPSTQPFEFKYSQSVIKFNSTYAHKVHSSLYTPIYAPDISKYIGRLSSRTNTIGPAGCGKSYISLFTDPMVGSVIALPQLTQADSCAGKYTLSTNTIPVGYIPPITTAQKIISDIGRDIAPEYETIRIDEAHQISQGMVNKILKWCTDNHLNLDLISDTEKTGDNRVVIYQRPAPAPCGEPISSLESFEWYLQISSVRRQSCADAAILDGLRGLSPGEMLRRIIPHVDTHLLGAPNVDKLYTRISELILAGSPVICSGHARISYLNKYVRDRASAHLEQEYKHLLTVPAVYKGSKKNREGMIPGAVYDTLACNVYWDRTSASEDIKTKVNEHGAGYRFEPAYVRTADARQGDTINQKYIIDITHINLPGYLYSALTRCARITDICLVELMDGSPDDIVRMNKRLNISYQAGIIARKAAFEAYIAPYVDASMSHRPVTEKNSDMGNPTTETPVLISTAEKNSADPGISLQVRSHSYTPRIYDKYATAIEIEPKAFITRSEFPYNRFLAHDSRESFIQWMEAQPADQRAYHEVITSIYRRLVIDIDCSDEVADPIATRRMCVLVFINAFNEYYKNAGGAIDARNLSEELAIIDSTGYSQLRQYNKFSLQLRVLQYTTTCDDAREFAAVYAKLLGDFGQYVDKGVYKSLQCFRIPGCTKHGDNRFSRCVNNAADTFVTTDIDLHRLAEYSPKPTVINLPLDQELTGRIIEAAAMYTEGLQYSYKSGKHGFSRMTPSHCKLCDDNHESDGMYVYTKDNSVYLRCWGATHGKSGRVSKCVKLFETSTGIPVDENTSE